VIFEQLMETIFVTIFFFSIFIDQKLWREKKKNRE